MLAGLGIAVIPAFTFTCEVTRGDVCVLLKKYEPKQLPMYAVYVSRRYLLPRVRVMIDFLADEFAIDPALSEHRV